MWFFARAFFAHRAHVAVRHVALKRAQKSVLTGTRARMAKAGGGRYTKHVRTGSGYRRKVSENPRRIRKYASKIGRGTKSAYSGRLTYGRSFQKGRKGSRKHRARRFYGQRKRYYRS